MPHIARLFRQLNTETLSGLLLMAAAVLALILSNTPLSYYYNLLLSTPMAISIGQFAVAKPLLLWINDGLMAIFFFMVGLELKREMLVGELSNPQNMILPGVGAVGGMAVPALIYVYFNADSSAVIGWAIPAATDIAFALGVLSLLGPRVPITLKLFLTSLAIFDDVGAVVIIALFYTDNISVTALSVVLVCTGCLFAMNRYGVAHKSAYIFIGLIMWVATLKSGVHATLAGVILAFFIPLKSRSDKDPSPLKTLEHDLHPLVNFLILPVFAFANAGIHLIGIGTEQLLHPVPVGIALGLFLGKQLGIFGLCGLAIKMQWAPMPKGMNWCGLYGASALCGVGFTMSLFIGSLAFEQTGIDQVFDERLGIILGSLASGALGFAVLKSCLPRVPAAGLAENLPSSKG